MERIYREKPVRKPVKNLKGKPQCERCGRPVKIYCDDYTREEILCAHCASEAKASSIHDGDSGPW